MANNAKRPEEVFTPRAAQVNDDMYVARPDLERALRRSLNGALHTILHGESGTGKSWLYKRLLKKEGSELFVANLANASRIGSLAKELANLVDREGNATKTGYTERKNLDVNVAVARGGIDHAGKYSIGEKEPFEACLDLLRKKAGDRRAVLVLDNLESVFDNPGLLKELADIVTLLDDERYSAYDVQLLVVGVPSGLKQYFFETPERATVANRLEELQEVARLSHDQCADLVTRGFSALGFTPTSTVLKTIADHVAWVTDRIPQRIHEYCLILAHAALDTNTELSAALFDDADRDFLRRHMMLAYTAVEQKMNERETKIGRRNQALMALGQYRGEEFRYSDIEPIVRDLFPASTAGKGLDVASILGHLADEPNPIIKRTPKGDSYTFCDPTFRMCIRAMLRKSEHDDSVQKIDLTEM